MFQGLLKAETSTPLPTYTDKTLGTAHPNPVVADTKGAFPEIWLQSVGYKMVLKNASGGLISTFDDVFGTPTSEFAAPVIETFTATEGQALFTLVSSTYVIGNNQLLPFVNGVFQVVGINYNETSTSSITFTEGLNAGDFVAILNNIPTTVIT